MLQIFEFFVVSSMRNSFDFISRFKTTSDVFSSFNNEIVHFLLSKLHRLAFDIHVDSTDLLAMLIVCGLRMGEAVYCECVLNVLEI